jgi:hypothetical protein
MSVAVLAGCSSGSKKEAVYAPPRLPTSVARPDAPTTSVPAAGAPATTRSPGAQVPGSDFSDGDVASPRFDNSAGPTPAQPGTYRYDTSGVSTFGLTSVPYPAVTTLAVSAPSGSHQHWTRDLRDPDGSGPISEFALDFRPDGVYLEDLTLTNSFQGMVNAQNLRPASPQLLVPAGAGPGAHSEFDLQGGNGGLAHVTVDVTGREAVTIGGQSVDTLVVRTKIVLPAGQVSGQVEFTGWFVPSVRIWAKESFVADASAAGGLFTFHSRYDATAQALAPS